MECIRLKIKEIEEIEMKILTNKDIKTLFKTILLCVLMFLFVSITILSIAKEHAAVCILINALIMAAVVLTVCCHYFIKQDKLFESAAAQIADYISGNRNARIACNEEGALYRLFHEINSLASILGAHVENEAKSKTFLQNTISDISHQLKTPLAALNIYNGIIQEEAENHPTVHDFAMRSEQELDRVEALVQSLLKIAKFDAGAIVMNKQQENVSELMEAVQAHFSFRASQEKKEILLSGDENTTLLCDRSWLLEAIDNLVKNALDHTKAGDSVQIQWNCLPTVLQITVKDNGSGIHPEDQYHIFKRFYRSRFSKETQGIGLGLPLAKTIIEAHGGTIEADSDLGMGTAFVVNILTAEHNNV